MVRADREGIDMPTNRRKQKRQRRSASTPDWVLRLKESGDIPERNDESEDWNDFISWYFLGLQVPGLPAPNEFEREQKINWRD